MLLASENAEFRQGLDEETSRRLLWGKDDSRRLGTVSNLHLQLQLPVKPLALFTCLSLPEALMGAARHKSGAPYPSGFTKS